MGPGMGAMGCECSAEDKPNRSCALSCATDHTEDLKMVIMVHRHGARHPTKQLGGDLCWPANKQFWESYKAQLTPTGAIQHNRLGKLLRQRYAGLFADLKPEEINNNVKVHTSNYQRTLFSATAFLSGMFPEVPTYYNYYQDRQDLDMAAMDKIIEDSAEKDSHGQKRGKTLGIPINVESNSSDDWLFHQIKAEFTPKSSKDFSKGGSVRTSKLFQKMDKDPEYIALCEKLFKITGKKKLLVEGDRIIKLKSVYTQIEIAKTHNLPLLPNGKNLTITNKEIEMIDKAAEVVIQHMFKPGDSDKVADGIGKDSAGFLGNEIARNIAERMDEKKSLRFIEYSCHDSTCLALASLLGVEVDGPGFAGHFLFELRKKPNSGKGDGWSVDVIWNGIPDLMSADDIVHAMPQALKLDDKYHTFSKLKQGPTDAKKLSDFLTLEALKTSALVFTKIKQWTKNKDEGALKGMKEHAEKHRASLSEQQSAEYKKAFDFFDADQNKTIDATELNSAFRRFGIQSIEHSEICEVLKCMEIEGNDHKLNYHEFVTLLSFFTEDAGAAAGREDEDSDDEGGIETYINLSIENKLKEIDDAEQKLRKEFKSRGDRAGAANDEAFGFMKTEAYADYVKTAFDKARGAEDDLDQDAFEAGFETILSDLFKASQVIEGGKWSSTKVDVSKDDAATWFKLVDDAGEGDGKNDGKVSLEEFRTLIDFCVHSTKLKQLEGLSADLSARPSFRRYQKTPFIMGNDCEIGYGFELTNGGPNQNGHLLCSHPFDIKTGEVHVSLEYYTKQIHADKERGEGLCVYLADPAVAKVCEEFEGSGVCGFAGKTGGICGVFFDLAGHISGKDEVCVRGADKSDPILSKTKVDKGLWSNEKFVQIHIKFDTVDKKIDVVLGPIDGGHKVLDNVDYPFDLPKKIIAGVCAGASSDNYSKICVNKLKLKSTAD